MDKLLLVALVCVGGVSLASGASKHACYQPIGPQCVLKHRVDFLV